MKIAIKTTWILGISFLFFSSCGRLILGADPEPTPMIVFDDLAYNIETRYSLFKDKGVDWQAITTEYREKINPDMGDDSLFQVLNAMLGELKDGHVNLSYIKDRGRNWSWKLDYPENFNYSIVERNYLGRNHRITQSFENTIIDSIGYIYYGSFSKTIKKKALNAMMDYMKDTKGLIIDIRNNGGGKLNNCGLLASYFTDTINDCMEFLYKSGPGPDDFDGPFAYEIKPSDTLNYTKPVVVLMNRSSFSGATFFPAMMSTFPNVTLMGDTSGGGGGIPFSFELPNGWVYRCSVSITTDCSGRNIEFGVLPDIKVDLDPKDEAKGIDTMIERALAELR